MLTNIDRFDGSEWWMRSLLFSKLTVVEFSIGENLKTKDSTFQKVFFCREEPKGALWYLLILCFGVFCGCCWFHLKTFPKKEKWHEKIYTVNSLNNTVVGFILTFIGVAAFGKPYSPFIISLFGLIFNSIVVTGFFHAPALCEWFDRSIAFVTCFTLFLQYFYRCLTSTELFEFF